MHSDAKIIGHHHDARLVETLTFGSEKPTFLDVLTLASC
jgi:hypothetical protein